MLGLQDEDIDNIILEINIKKDAGYVNTKRRFPDTWQERMFNRWKRLRKTLGCIPIEELPAVENYYREVNKFTELSCIIYPTKIKDLDKRSREWHLDHKYSRHQGYINNVPPEVIGHYTNLEVISNIENGRKQDKCSITLEELYLLTEKALYEDQKNNGQ